MIYAHLFIHSNALQYVPSMGRELKK